MHGATEGSLLSPIKRLWWVAVWAARARAQGLIFGVDVRYQAPGASSTISMRRFCARPSGVSLGDRMSIANPFRRYDIWVTPWERKQATTLSARARTNRCCRESPHSE